MSDGQEGRRPHQHCQHYMRRPETVLPRCHMGVLIATFFSLKIVLPFGPPYLSEGAFDTQAWCVWIAAGFHLGHFYFSVHGGGKAELGDTTAPGSCLI